MTSWPEGPPPGAYPGQAPPPGFQVPQQPLYPGYPQQGYPQQGYTPGQQWPTAPPIGYSGPFQTNYGQAAPQQPGMYGPGSEDHHPLDDDNTFMFSEKSVRRAFIRKVYSILMVQLLATGGIISFFMFHEPTKKYVRMNPWICWVSFPILFILLIAFSCFNDLRRKTPQNYIFLGIFTAVKGFMLGCAAALYSKDEILYAVLITAVVCFSLTVFAFQTKWDFTLLSGALCVAAVILLLFGFILLFARVKILILVFSCFAALLFSVYLVYDTQLMMGGNHKFSLSPEEYIFAALNLYIDIVQIFISILNIIGLMRN